MTCDHTSVNRSGSFSSEPAITILGDRDQGGAYILRIKVAETIVMTFGRFKSGASITVPAGEALYVGSAMNNLGPRLTRHATRSGQIAAHPIRAQMLALFPKIGLGIGPLLPTKEKRLRWHVDHLLDRKRANLTHVIIIRSRTRLERKLGRYLEADSGTFVLERGLGASDVPGNTHLLGVRVDEAWWRALPARLADFVEPG